MIVEQARFLVDEDDNENTPLKTKATTKRKEKERKTKSRKNESKRNRTRDNTLHNGLTVDVTRSPPGDDDNNSSDDDNDYDYM